VGKYALRIPTAARRIRYDSALCGSELRRRVLSVWPSARSSPPALLAENAPRNRISIGGMELRPKDTERRLSVAGRSTLSSARSVCRLALLLLVSPQQLRSYFGVSCDRTSTSRAALPRDSIRGRYEQIRRRRSSLHGTSAASTVFLVLSTSDRSGPRRSHAPRQRASCGAA